MKFIEKFDKLVRDLEFIDENIGWIVGKLNIVSCKLEGFVKKKRKRKLTGKEEEEVSKLLQEFYELEARLENELKEVAKQENIYEDLKREKESLKENLSADVQKFIDDFFDEENE